MPAAGEHASEADPRRSNVSHSTTNPETGVDEKVPDHYDPPVPIPGKQTHRSPPATDVEEAARFDHLAYQMREFRREFRRPRRPLSGQLERFRSQMIRNPSSVSHGATTSITGVSLATSSASPPVPITFVPGPSSSRKRATIPSTRPA